MRTLAAILVLVVVASIAIPAAQNVQAYQTIQQAGSGAPQRRVLNFTNATVADDPSNGRTNVTIATGMSPVTSVFGRTGAVVAQTGDYSATQVTNAVSTISSYADPTWITSLGPSKVGAAIAQWNANLLQGFGIATAAPANGQVLAWNGVTNLWTPTTPASGGGSNLTVAVNGTTTGTQATLNFNSSANITQACANNGAASRVDCTPSVNTAIVPTITAIQNGAPLFCASSNGTTAATCTLANTGSHALGAYTKGLFLAFVTDTGSPTTLNVDTLGAVTIDQKDCSTAVGSNIAANRPYWLYYNGTVFCLVA